jgi:hypothetical protein
MKDSFNLINGKKITRRKIRVVTFNSEYSTEGPRKGIQEVGIWKGLSRTLE